MTIKQIVRHLDYLANTQQAEEKGYVTITKAELEYWARELLNPEPEPPAQGADMSGWHNQAYERLDRSWEG